MPNQRALPGQKEKERLWRRLITGVEVRGRPVHRQGPGNVSFVHGRRNDAIEGLEVGLGGGSFRMHCGGLCGTGASVRKPEWREILGQSVMEPTFNNVTGTVTYVMTPINAPEQANSRAWAPFYVPVYPVSSFANVGTLQCTDAVPALNQVENCPDHGPAIAGAVEASGNPVYSSGVLGHDHLMAPPASGGDSTLPGSRSWWYSSTPLQLSTGSRR